MYMHFSPENTKLTKDATEYLIFEISRLSPVKVVQLVWGQLQRWFCSIFLDHQPSSTTGLLMPSSSFIRKITMLVIRLKT